MLDSAAQPAIWRLGAERCTVGAAGDCDVVIEDGSVSRKHAVLELVPEGVSITDLGSRNGTFYLGHKVEKICLSLGSRFTVGATTIALDPDVESLKTPALYAGDEYHGIVGTSPVMRALFATLVRLEGSLVSVLVHGESGVGKELVAKALHDGSSVKEKPLVVVNCGAMPRELIASELFGHRRGAFTGAVESRKGAFELANGGTIFMDEIGELPLDLQPVLLRVLETGEVRPVGGEPLHVRVRVVAATNRDLAQEVADGRFREDLFFRLAVVQLVVPPLRDRLEDIPALARRFATAVGVSLPVEVIEQLKGRAYPGNVRELRNVVQAWAALGSLPQPPRVRSDGGLERMLAERMDISAPYAEQKERFNDVFTRVYLRALLSATGGNQSQAAKIAGLNRSYLGRLVVKAGLGRG